MNTISRKCVNLYQKSSLLQMQHYYNKSLKFYRKAQKISLQQFLQLKSDTFNTNEIEMMSKTVDKNVKRACCFEQKASLLRKKHPISEVVSSIISKRADASMCGLKVAIAQKWISKRLNINALPRI